MKEAIRELLPPDDDGKPLSALTRWRIAVFGACVGFFAFMSWALSPWGFALAGDFRTLRDTFDDMRLGQLEQQVYDAKQSECVAGDKDTKRFFATRVGDLARAYRNLARAEVRVPPCAVGESNRESTDE